MGIPSCGQVEKILMIFSTVDLPKMELSLDAQHWTVAVIEIKNLYLASVIVTRSPPSLAVPLHSRGLYIHLLM